MYYYSKNKNLKKDIMFATTTTEIKFIDGQAEQRFLEAIQLKEGEIVADHGSYQQGRSAATFIVQHRKGKGNVISQYIKRTTAITLKNETRSWIERLMRFCKHCRI